MPKCAACPAAGPCVVEWTGHRPYCVWAAAGGARRDRVAELSADPPVGFVAAPAAIDVAESLRLVAAVKRCPYRSTDSSCGCSGARCALRHGRWVATNECFLCIQRYGSG